MDRVLAEALIRPAPTLPQSGGFEDQVTKLMESFSQRLDQLAARIDGAGVVDETFTEILLTPAPQRQMPCFWADRLLDETPDYNTIISWPDNEDTNGQNLVEVSDTTAELLKSSFTRSLPNATRLALKKGYAVPKVDATKCPKLDRVMRGNVSKNTKDGDSTATKIQTLMLDAVAPLVHILEEGQKGTLTPEVAIKATGKCVCTSVQGETEKCPKRHEQRRDVSRRGKGPIQGWAPLLFGDGFEKKMKEHVDTM